MTQLTKKMVEMLNDLDQAQQRLIQAMMNNTKFCPLEHQEQMQSDYYLRRSTVLMKLQCQRPEDEVLGFLKVATDATLVKVEYHEKTKVKT